MSEVQAASKTQIIPLSALSVQYERLPKAALTNGQIVFQNGQLFNVPNSTGSPYHKDTLCAFVPLVSESWTGKVTFQLPSTLIFNNLTHPNPTYKVDFGDGNGYQIILPDQPIEVEYKEAGAKTIRTSILLGTNKLESQAIFFIANTASVQERGNGPNYEETEEDVIPIAGGGGSLRIFYASPCKKLVKPIVIIEGFELNDEPDRFRDRLIKDIFPAVPVITGYDGKFGEYLYKEGYDIVWVDLENIQDYIQNSAEVVKRAMAQVNSIKFENGSSQANVILGTSAGGIIGKYFLLKAQQDGFDHQCELFFTYDAPLRGANIPLSIQCLLKHAKYIGDDNGANILGGNNFIALAFNALDGPFAQQTLLKRFQYTNGNNFELTSAPHDAFMAEMDAMGTLNVKHIALSNGSVSSTSRANISPGAQMYSASSSGSAWSVGITAPPIWIVNVSFDATGFATSAFSSNLIYDGNFKVKVDGITTKEYPLKVTSATTDAYDTAPGASSNLAIIALTALNGLPMPTVPAPGPFGGIAILDVPMSNLSLEIAATHYCFIPTRSSISAANSVPLNGPFNCGQSSANRCSVNTIPTILPAVSYPTVTTPELNQDHVFLDARIGDIVANELSVGNNSNSGVLPSVLQQYFNIGTGSMTGIKPLVIKKGGKLSINNTGRIGFAIGNEPLAVNQSLSAYMECYADVVIEDGASLVIGADNKSQHGLLVVGKESNITIKTGGTLRITSSQSKLILKRGARLIIEPGAKIILSDPNSELRIEEGATLELLGQPDFSGEGYWHFAGDNELVMGTNMPTWFLKGTGKTKRMLMVEGQKWTSSI